MCGSMQPHVPPHVTAAPRLPAGLGRHICNPRTPPFDLLHPPKHMFYVFQMGIQLADMSIFLACMIVSGQNVVSSCACIILMLCTYGTCVTCVGGQRPVSGGVHKAALNMLQLTFFCMWTCLCCLPASAMSFLWISCPFVRMLSSLAPDVPRV